LILQVTPRTSPDGTIVMQVYAEKSSVGPLSTAVPIGTDENGNPILSPQIPRTLAQTTVSARTGQTVILGGLITKDLEEQTRRVPYLGDIPVLGRLFRFDTASNVRTELLIILTPYLVTSEEQVEWMNARETERMSWCVADIVNIHGPVNISGNPAFNSGPTPLIYPDLHPGGLPDAPSAELLPPFYSGPYGSPYPVGPPPYEDNMSRPQDGSNATPLPAVPGVVPPGPIPYQEPPGPLPSAPTVPPPTPGLGSSRRTNDEYFVPPPASLNVPPPAANPGGLAPPTIQPAAPPAGTAAFPATATPYLPLPAGPPPMLPLPGPVAPAEYQQPLNR
jgi:hypothetical protein